MIKKVLGFLLLFSGIDITASESPENIDQWLQSEADPLPGQRYSYTDTVFSSDEESLAGSDSESSGDEEDFEDDKENQSPNEK